MVLFFRITAALLIVDLILLGTWISVRPGAGIADVTPFVVTAGVLAALITLAVNYVRQGSQDLLEGAVELLRRGYETLAEKKDEMQRPLNSRLNWLTAARLVKAAENVGALIFVDSHKRVWHESREYWRGRFYDLIWPDIEGFPANYYGDKGGLSEKSLTVLYRFVRWPEGLPDPLEGDPEFTYEEIERMVAFGPRGLGTHVRAGRERRKPK